MTCDMVCWRWCALELRIARLWPSEDTFEDHSGPAGVGRASRIASASVLPCTSTILELEP